jgi:hypothetical protein
MIFHLVHAMRDWAYHYEWGADGPAAETDADSQHTE